MTKIERKHQSKVKAITVCHLLCACVYTDTMITSVEQIWLSECVDTFSLETILLPLHRWPFHTLAVVSSSLSTDLLICLLNVVARSYKLKASVWTAITLHVREKEKQLNVCELKRRRQWNTRAREKWRAASLHVKSCLSVKSLVQIEGKRIRKAKEIQAKERWLNCRLSVSVGKKETEKERERRKKVRDKFTQGFIFMHQMHIFPRW